MIGLDQCWHYLGLLSRRVRQNRVAPGYLLIKGPRFVPGFDTLQCHSPIYSLSDRPPSDSPTQEVTNVSFDNAKVSQSMARPTWT
jgi:hypothetical protein